MRQSGFGQDPGEKQNRIGNLVSRYADPGDQKQTLQSPGNSGASVDRPKLYRLLQRPTSLASGKGLSRSAAQASSPKSLNALARVSHNQTSWLAIFQKDI